MTDARRRDLLAIAILAAVPTLLFLDILLGTAVFYTRDVSLYHFPQKKILHDIVASGEFPFWNPFYSAGQPLAANPAHEVFYPLTWLVMLFGLFYGFQLLALIHVYIASFATYALLRSLGTSRTAAAIGGLSFGLGGFAMSGLNLFPFLFSAAWMPLTCLFTRRFLRERSPRDFAFASIAFALQFLVGEPVTIAQTGLLLGLYALFRERQFLGGPRVPRSSSEILPRNPRNPRNSEEPRGPLKDLAFVGAISLAALLLAAAQMLPAIDHASESVRAEGFDFASVSERSTPLPRLLETVFPDVFGAAQPDSMEPYWGGVLYGERRAPFFVGIYSGLLIAAMAFAGLLARIRGTRLYVATICVSMLFALGSHTPLWRLLYDLGLVRAVRYPEKFLIMGIFATVIFGALAFDELLRGNARIRRIGIAFAVVTAITAAIVAAITSAPLIRAVWSHPSDVTDARVELVRYGWILAALRGALLAGLFAAMTRMRRSQAIVFLGVFAVADLGFQSTKLAPRTAPAFYTEPPLTVQQLAPNRGEYRIFHIGDWTRKSPLRIPYVVRRPHSFVLQRNALLGQSPAIWGLRTAVDVDFDLTTLAVSTEFTRAAWDLEEATPRWLDYITAMSNIRYIALFRPIEDAVREAGGDVRYMRPVRFVEGFAHPRYYFATQIATARNRAEFVRAIATNRYDTHAAFVANEPFQPAPGRVLRWAETANSAQIEVEADGLAFLVMSVTPHKYWVVAIDGVEVPSIRTNIGYQGIVVPRGRHLVTMRYRNPLIAAGAAISLATLCALFLVAWRSRAAVRMRNL